MNKKKLFIAIGFFWFIVIAGFIGIKEYTLKSGTIVMLKTMPVDPRDLFRGDYVILRYEMSNIQLNKINHDAKNYESGSTVYVELEPSDSVVKPVKIYSQLPKDKLSIKGVVKNSSENTISVEYGIESYFVPEGKGRDIERKMGKNVEVQIAIDKVGKAVIKDLFIDKEKLIFSN